jgi:hypothetical protein
MNMRLVPGSRPRHRGALGLCLALAALPAAAQVGPLTYQSLFYNQASSAHGPNYLAADAGLIYTNNAQVTSNGGGDTLAIVGLSGDTSRQGSRLDYHLDSDVSLVKYGGGTFPTEPTGYLDGRATLRIVPGFFSWIARDTYTQVQIDPFAAVTPDNLENLNYITTGPRFTLQPTLRTSVTLEAVYSYVSSSSPSPQYVNIDSHRYGGELKIERAFSSAARLYLTGDYEKVDFKDQTVNNNFTVADGTLGYHLDSDRTSLDVSGGYSQIQVQDVLVPVDTIIGTVERPETQTFGGANWSFRLSRLISPTQRVALYATQQFTDAAAALRVGFDQPIPTIAPPQVAAGAPFQNRGFGASWRFELARTSLAVSLVDTRQHYLTDSSLDRDVKLASALFARQLSPALNWDIGASYQHWVSTSSTTSTSGQTANVIGEITNLRWRLGQRFALRFIVAHSSEFGVSYFQVGVLASYVLAGAGQPYGQQPELQPLSPVSMQAPPR